MHFIEAGAGNCLRICIFIFASIFTQNLVDTLANGNFYFKAPKCVLVQGDFSNTSLHLFSLFNIQEKFTLVTKDSPKFWEQIVKKCVCLYYHSKLLLSYVFPSKWWLSRGSQHLVVIFFLPTTLKWYVYMMTIFKSTLIKPYEK